VPRFTGVLLGAGVRICVRQRALPATSASASSPAGWRWSRLSSSRCRASQPSRPAPRHAPVTCLDSSDHS